MPLIDEALAKIVPPLTIAELPAISVRTFFFVQTQSALVFAGKR